MEFKILKYIISVITSYPNNSGIIISFIACWILFLSLIHRDSKTSKNVKDIRYQWVSRIVSNYHAIWISITSIIFLATTMIHYPNNDLYELLLNLDAGPRPSWVDCLWKFSLGVTTGYLTYDLIVVFAYLDRKISTIIHHVITAPFMWWLQFDYPIYAAIGMLSEISTPFLNRGWFQINANNISCLRSYRNQIVSGKTHTSRNGNIDNGTVFTSKGAQVSSLTKYGLLTSYFVFRVLLFPYIFVMSLVKQEYYAAPLCFIITILNLVWFCKLIKLSKGRENSHRKKQTDNFDEESNTNLRKIK